MTNKKILVDIDLNQNELQNAVVQNLATAPSNPKKGQHYFNTVDNTEYVWDGTKWVNALSQGDYVFENGVSEDNRHVTLDIATKDSIGGVTIGDNIDVNSGVISVKTGNKDQAGILALATDTEAAAGTNDTKAVTPKQAKTELDKKVDKNEAITGGTHTKITYDSKGLVTGGSDLAEADIPDLHLEKIVDVTATATEVNYTSGVTSSIQDQLDSKIPSANIVDNTTTADPTKVLSANMGKELQDAIDILNSRGRYLALWDCSTGLPTTNPTSSPYQYKTGDYFIVGKVAEGTNYKPSGSSYTTGVASTDVETQTVLVNDTYIYDGTHWVLQTNAQREISFSNIAGDAYDNTSLATALNDKVSGNTAITGGTHTKITYDDKGLVTDGSDLSASDIPDLSDTYLTPDNTKTLTNKTISATNNTISNLETGNFKAGVVQTTVRNTATASDTALASEKAISTALALKMEKLTATNPALTPSGGVCVWTVNNTLRSADVVISVREVATGEEVYTSLTCNTNSIIVKINSTAGIEAGTYKIVVIG